ncbi:MAG: hypothetical protein WDN23_10340 [Edaphobacter sp.]
MSHKTEFASTRFKASDNPPGTVQTIGTLENGSDSNTVLHSKLDFYLRLKPGIDFREAEKIADYLNKHVDGISVTFPV